MSVHGFVLAGGRSTRMGRDKALLAWRGGALLAAVARQLAPVVEGVTIIGSPALYGGLGYEVVPDLTPGLGPLGGIETALSLERAEWNLIVACDMPNLTTATLGQLVELASTSDADCVLPLSAGERAEPLCAVYRRSCLRVIRQALAADDRKVTNALKKLQVVHFSLENQDEVLNLNTPGDWAAFLGSQRG
jgi:molybdenum cofactor guanylyltransferase